MNFFVFNQAMFVSASSVALLDEQPPPLSRPPAIINRVPARSDTTPVVIVHQTFSQTNIIDNSLMKPNHQNGAGLRSLHIAENKE